MKYSLCILFTAFIFTATLQAQTLDDLRQIENLKRQLEKAGDIPTKTIPESTTVRSLEVFQDSVSVIPKPDQAEGDSGKVEKDKTEVAENPFSELPVFGFDLFKNANLNFNPEVYGPVDADYPIGAGDQIIISLWGEVELRHDLTVDRNGQIFIPDVGLVKASGFTLGDLKKKLVQVMGRSYSSLLKNKAYLDVSLGKLRSIRLFVVGDVNKPGVFTVPALTSAFNMFFYAAGIKETGSLRRISLVRNDEEVEILDIYDFLNHGKQFSSIRLQQNDVIVVPTAVKHVYLAGAANKKAIFELKDDEGLLELIKFAGGFKDNAYMEQIQIERYSANKDRKLIDVNYKHLISDNRNFTLENGDRVLVNKLNRDIENFVTIDGPIYGPKKFEYMPGMTVGELFAKVDSVRGDAFLERIHITRTLPDRKKQVFSINLKMILEKAQNDFDLAAQDHISIKSKSDLFPPDSVSIYGAVNSPGKYLLKKSMTLRDLVFDAGGFRKDAKIMETEISRVDPQNSMSDSLATILYVAVDTNYVKEKLTDDQAFYLQAYDNVFVRANSDWELQRNVMVKGEVNLPGTYTLRSKNERITDIVKRAGGLKPTSYLKGATLVRNQDNAGKIGLDFERIFKNPKDEDNIYLIDGDVITIPEQLHTVKVAGGVNFPSSVLFEKGKGAGYYINSAGGFSELANEKNVSVRLANGRVFKQKRFLFWKYWPKDITAGSTIYVPTFAEKPRTDWSGAIRDAAAILSSVATTILIINEVK